jgi:hypothetical protein
MSNGYSKEKADKAIADHERKAREFDNIAHSGGAIRDQYVKDAEASAAAERAKADNLRELKKHWGDK